MKKNPVFIELIVVLLFLSIASTLVLQAFVKADLLSKEAERISLVQYEIQNTLEKWKADPEDLSIFQGWKKSGNTYSTTLNKGKDPIKAVLKQSEKNGGILYEIHMSSDFADFLECKYVKEEK